MAGARNGRSNQHLSEQVSRAADSAQPFAEQHCIVAKVDELAASCEEVEAQFTEIQTDSRRLLEAVLNAALTERYGGTVAACSDDSGQANAEASRHLLGSHSIVLWIVLKFA